MNNEVKPMLIFSRKLTKEMIREVLKESYPKPVYYLFDGILEKLKIAYPGVPIYRNVVAKMLLSMGYGRRHLNPETLEPVEVTHYHPKKLGKSHFYIFGKYFSQ